MAAWPSRHALDRMSSNPECIATFLCRGEDRDPRGTAFAITVLHLRCTHSVFFGLQDAADPRSGAGLRCRWHDVQIQMVDEKGEVVHCDIDGAASRSRCLATMPELKKVASAELPS